MKINKDIKETLSFDPEKCTQLYSDVVEAFQKHRPTVGEIIIALGNLCYTLGASIGKFPIKGPSPQEVAKMNLANPERIDYALMAQGLLITSWYENWETLMLEKIDKNNIPPKIKE